MRIPPRDTVSLYATAAKNTLGYFGLRTHPPAVLWVITKRCFYSCIHCDSWKDSTPIDEAIVAKIAGELAAAQTKLVAISGGEPLMIKSLPDVVAKLKSAGKIVSLNTNGHLLEENVEWIVDAGVNNIQISIDADTPELHDRIRQREGSFETILRAIDRLKNARRDGLPRISICGVAMKENLGRLAGFVDRFKAVADDVELQPLHETPDWLMTAGCEPLAPRDESLLRDDLRNVMARDPRFATPYYEAFTRFLFDRDSMKHMATDHCLPRIFNTLVIQGNGDAYICRFPLQHNVVESGLSAAWNSSERWQLYRMLSRDGCSDPCWSRCNIHSSSQPGRAMKSALGRVRK